MKKTLSYTNPHLLCKQAPKDLFFTAQTSKASFTLNQVTVLFLYDKDKIDITFFELSGKEYSRLYQMPKNEIELLSLLREHCGEEFINKQIKP